MDHINSYKRKKLNNCRPYEMFSLYYGENVLIKFGCSRIAIENIILKPKSLKTADKYAEYHQKRKIVSDQNKDGLAEYKNFTRKLISGCCIHIYCWRYYNISMCEWKSVNLAYKAGLLDHKQDSCIVIYLFYEYLWLIAWIFIKNYMNIRFCYMKKTSVKIGVILNSDSR